MRYQFRKVGNKSCQHIGRICLGGALEINKNRVNELRLEYPKYKFFTDIDLAFVNLAKIIGWINEKVIKYKDKDGKSKCNRFLINNNLVFKVI